MTAIRDWPISRKLTAILLLVTGVVLLLTLAAFGTYQAVTLRQSALKSLATLGRAIAANATASLAFVDESDAREILGALRAEPDVVAAALYDGAGRLFATYPADLSPVALPSTLTEDGYHFAGDFLIGIEPVAQPGSARLGSLYLKSDLRAVGGALRLFGLIALAIMGAAFLAAIMLATVLQQKVSQPLLTLARTAKAVSDNQDYSARAPQLGRDELGTLTDAFNHMLERIQDQEQALRESKERLDLAVQSAGVGTWDWHIDTGSVRWDSRMFLLFGLEPHTPIGDFEDFLPLVHPDDRERVTREVQAAIHDGAPYDIEFRVIWPDGSQHILASRGKVYRDGGQARMTGVSWDVTERRLAEEQLLHLAAIIESTSDAIITRGIDGTIRSWNPGAQRLFGYRQEEIMGRPLTDLIADEFREDEPAIVERLLEGERLQSLESVWCARGGRRLHVSLTASLIRDDSGKVIGVSQIVRDVTRQRRAEERMRELIAELERSNEELEQFAYVASHDLQEPLRMVSSYTDLLRRRYGDRLDADALEFIQFAINGATRMQGLIHDLLEFARIGTRGRPMLPVDANRVWTSVRANFEPALRENGGTLTSDPLPSVMADETQLAQLFQNLVGNAIKFRGEERPRVHITAREEPSEWIFSVQDNGIGIDPEYFERVFVVFQRLHLKEEYPGTGIGLALCRRIVERHGGRIWVESQPGQGSTFHFSLPKKVAQPSPETSAA